MKPVLLRNLGLAALWLLVPDCANARSGSRSQDAVRLADIKALTFYSGKLTTSRRVDPIPQVSCVGGSGNGLFTPDTIRCRNSGSSYSTADIEWTCQASLPPEFKLGSTEVVCEGYNNADDDFVLKGSCGLEYRLILTDLGEEKFGKDRFRKPFYSGNRHDGSATKNSTRWSIETFLFVLLFVGVACWMFYAAFFRNQNIVPPTRRSPRTTRFGNGYADGDDDPPPPYDPQPPPPRSRPQNPWSGSKRSPRTSTSSYYPSQASNPNGSNSRWRPGFWTGLGSGMLAGAAGARAYNNRRDNTYMPPQQTTWGYGGASPERRASGSSQSYSTERYTSTGFGGTRRR